MAGALQPIWRFVTASVSGKNQPKENGWHRAFRLVNGRLGVSETDRSWPRVSGGTCPRCPKRDPSPANSPPGSAGRAMWCWLLGLQQPHVGGLGALRPRRHVELDGLPLSK